MSPSPPLTLVTPRVSLPLAYEQANDVAKTRLLNDCFTSLSQQILQEQPERAAYKIAPALTDEDRVQAFRSQPYDAFRMALEAQDYTVMRTTLRYPSAPMATPVILIAKGKLSPQERQQLKNDALSL